MKTTLRSSHDFSSPNARSETPLPAGRITTLLRHLVNEGRKLIWLPRCKDNIARQRSSYGISSRDKLPDASAWCNGSITDAAQSLATPNRPRVLINPASLNRHTDPYRCHCGVHSLLHSPGMGCDRPGLNIHRARTLALSNFRNQLKPIPFIMYKGPL